MSNKIELIKKQNSTLWKWIGTRKHSFVCSETVAEEFIVTCMQNFDEKGKEVLDLYVYKLEHSYFNIKMVTVEMLIRPKIDEGD